MRPTTERADSAGDGNTGRARGRASEAHRNAGGRDSSWGRLCGALLKGGLQGSGSPPRAKVMKRRARRLGRRLRLSHFRAAFFGAAAPAGGPAAARPPATANRRRAQAQSPSTFRGRGALASGPTSRRCACNEGPQAASPWGALGATTPGTTSTSRRGNNDAPNARREKGASWPRDDG